MNREKLNAELEKVYNRRYKSIEKRVSVALAELSSEMDFDVNSLELEDMKSVVTQLLKLETDSLEDDLESLLAQKELIERSLEKKHAQLQEATYDVFNVLEEKLTSHDEALAKLHQVKMQSIDLYDILSEMVESALITVLEKDADGEIKDTIEEIIKDTTFHAIKEGSLNTIRIRKILSTILISAMDIAEATPNRAEDILRATLKGMRGGLISSIDRFKKRLAFVPVEAKHILVEDYDTIIADLNQTDTLFSQVIITQASESSQEIRKILIELNKEMHYDLEELVHLSKETADVMKEKFSDFAKKAVKRADIALKSEKAKEAKRVGVEAWGIAKVALGSALKSAKDAIDKKEK